MSDNSSFNYPDYLTGVQDKMNALSGLSNVNVGVNAGQGFMHHIKNAHNDPMSPKDLLPSEFYYVIGKDEAPRVINCLGALYPAGWYPFVRKIEVKVEQLPLSLSNPVTVVDGTGKVIFELKDEEMVMLAVANSLKDKAPVVVSDDGFSAWALSNQGVMINKSRRKGQTELQRQLDEATRFFKPNVKSLQEELEKSIWQGK